jgi:hypothetical protein
MTSAGTFAASQGNHAYEMESISETDGRVRSDEDGEPWNERRAPVVGECPFHAHKGLDDDVVRDEVVEGRPQAQETGRLKARVAPVGPTRLDADHQLPHRAADIADTTQHTEAEERVLLVS